MNIVAFLFYIGIALFFFGVPFPYLELVIAITALVLGVKSI